MQQPVAAMPLQGCGLVARYATRPPQCRAGAPAPHLPPDRPPSRAWGAALPRPRPACLERRRIMSARHRMAFAAAGGDGEGDGSREAGSGSVDDGTPPTVYIKRTLRGGQIEDHPGTVVVCGDVNRGSLVAAGGDVIIWGRLRGEAHAGKLGDRSATIMALDMEPTQLRIADKIAYGPEDGSGEYPELAQLGGDGTITVAPAGHVGLQTAEERAARRARLTSSGSAKDKWTPGARVARFTGAYIATAGLALLLAPAKVFGLIFDLRMVSTGWVQVGGVLATAFGINYLVTAYGDSMGAGARSYYVSTVASRVFIFVAFGLLVATRCVQPQLLVLGILNLMGAASMFTALNKPPPA